MKYFGIWLGVPLILMYLLSFTNIFSYDSYIILEYLIIITGTIIGIVNTHKALGHNIRFGKAVAPVLLFIGGIFVLSLIVNVIRWGSSFIDSWFIYYWLTQLFTELVIGVSILLAAGTWYMFEKAGKPGWAMIVPIYNLIVMCEIAKKPGWWVVMFLIPIANIVFLIMMLNGISKNFGKDSGFTVGLVFLRQIFFAILGYGDAQYIDNIKTTNDSVIDNI